MVGTRKFKVLDADIEYYCKLNRHNAKHPVELNRHYNNNDCSLTLYFFEISAKGAPRLSFIVDFSLN